MYYIFVSRAFQKQFKDLDASFQERVRKALRELSENPFKSRPRADIKLLINTHPQKYRLRIGNFRIVYYVMGDTVKIIEIFRRKKGYQE